MNIDSRYSVGHHFLLAGSGERAADTLTRVTGYRRSPGEDNDAQLFAQSRTLRIRQENSLEFSNVGPTSPLQAAAILPPSDFHEFSRAVGPKRQGRKSLRLCLAGLRIGRFDPIAEAAELPDHSCGALLLRLFGDGWAPFFVTDSLVQDQPDQPTLSMGNGPNGLIVSQARHRAAIHNLEDASFGSGCGVGRLIE